MTSAERIIRYRSARGAWNEADETAAVTRTTMAPIRNHSVQTFHFIELGFDIADAEKGDRNADGQAGCRWEESRAQDHDDGARTVRTAISLIK